MISWLRNSHQPAASESFLRVLEIEGVRLTHREASETKVSDVTIVLGDAELSSLLVQLADEGFAVSEGQTTLIPWDSMYQLMRHPQYCRDLEVFALPPIENCVPSLESFNTLIDIKFAIAISDWITVTGERLHGVELIGPVLKTRGRLVLLSEPVWKTIQLVSAFHSRQASERTDLHHRRAWGQIRQAAMTAGARLDGFLYKNIVLTPEKLDIGLRKSEIPGHRIVEVEPSFKGAPDDWLQIFDSRSEVPNRYDIPTEGGIVQILITPQVKTVLQQIKQMPGRRVAGSRAEAFLLNPFAALGEDASTVIDEQQFEQSKEEADLGFERFTAHVEKDALGYPNKVGILVESASKGQLASSHVRWFATDVELAEFVTIIRQSLNADLQLCDWDGYDFELLGETSSQIQILEDAYRARQEPRILVSYANIFDLSNYSSRVEEIGVEKSYYSPFIAKKKDEDSWFPENLIPMISWTPEGEKEAVAVPITEEAKEQLKAKIHEAETSGATSFTIKGFDKPIPVKEAKFILDTFDEAFSDARKGVFDPNKPKHGVPPKGGKHLVIKANIQSIDYEEARRDILLALPSRAVLPKGIKGHVKLKAHQDQGVAWLQHLFLNSPKHCRGAVLADDMGLGKTLQLLALIAWALERDPGLAPALIVAPVSLLENWKEEAERFFTLESLPILTAYGSFLTGLRVPRAAIESQLRQEGLVKFLKPGWRGDAKIVLTTYETLRDLEFSFATEKWSIMVCDEAQRIKNPNAMVTRAAKKQNVTFKIACTGTPVENTLADMWCLFDFIQPGLLGALNEFGRRYRRPIEAETDEEKARVEELRSKISPQILRRMKKDVARDLPNKIVEPCNIPLSQKQRALYAQAVDLFRKRNIPGNVVPFKNHLGLLHYLRLICTDPRKIGLSIFKAEDLKAYQEKAPKMAWLMQTLDVIRARNEKVIVFCEFREIQRMLRHYIEEVFGFAPDIINGDTSASSSHVASRQKRIRSFQESPGFGVIILSPVAVGFGVNIQAANHVVHYTRTWNPAKEDQATDRSYRIGQEKDVHVYCPVVYADDFTTFDVKLDQLLSAKRKLAEDMLNGTGELQPGEFDIAEVVPGTGLADDSRNEITLDDALRMNWEYLEALTAVIMKKKGFKCVYLTPKTDDGVDVVAYTNNVGELVQCKSSGSDNAALSWDAVKDVVTGAAAYRAKHPGVTFRKSCLTNQHFNATAHKHAELNEVTLVSQEQLGQLLIDYPVTMFDVERLLYTDWSQGQSA
jgi:hypothetical protein